MKSSSFASSSQRSYTSARFRSRTVGSSPTTTSSMIASDMPTGRSARRALIASRAATWPALMPSANASISSGSITFARRYVGTPASRLHASRVARSTSRMKSGRFSQLSSRVRLGSFIVTAYAIRSPNRSITRSQ